MALHCHYFPLSILYGSEMLFLPTYVFKFVVSIKWFLLKYTELILTISNSSHVFSCVISCPSLLTSLGFLLLHSLWKWPALLHLVHVLLCAGHCICVCVLPHYLHAGHDGMLCCAVFLRLLLCNGLDIFILLSSLDVVIVLITAAWALCAPTLFTHTGTFPLVICILLFTVVKSLIILLACFHHKVHE